MSAQAYTRRYENGSLTVHLRQQRQKALARYHARYSTLSLRERMGHPRLWNQLDFDDLAAVSPLNVLVEDDLELFDDMVALEGGEELAVDVDGGLGFLEGAGERDADVGVLGFAGAVDDAAHYRDVEPLDARIARLPFRHGVADEVLDAGGELLESGRGGAAAARTGGDQRHEGAQPHGLEEFLRHLDFESAVAVRLRRERNADGVADALLQENAHGGRRG